MSKINSLFWSEFSETCSSNRVLSDSQLAEKLLETFRKFYDNNVAIEVSSDYTNREIIFCGGHSKVNLTFVDELLSEKVEIKNFKINGPKPAMGFNFALSTRNSVIDGSKIFFLPLRSSSSDELGISLFIEGVSDIDEGILWKIVETGIGEIAASEISYIRLDRGYDSDYLGVDLLNAYIVWFKKNRE